MTRVVIIGTGDQALSLCSFFQSNNGGASGNSLLVTKKNLDKVAEGSFFHDTGIKLANFTEAVTQADVVIFAIPARALRVFVPENYSILKDKILVDATNSSVRGEDLHELVNVTDVRWVKAFFDIGAIDGMLSKPYSKFKTASKMCSAYSDSLKVVKEFAEESLGFDVKVVPYERYQDIAMHQNSLGNEWLIAGVYMFFWFCVFQFYNIMRHHVHKGYEYYNLPLFSTNKIIAWLTLHGMTTAMIPGKLRDRLIPCYESPPPHTAFTQPNAKQVYWPISTICGTVTHSAPNRNGFVSFFRFASTLVSFRSGSWSFTSLGASCSSIKPTSRSSLSTLKPIVPK